MVRASLSALLICSLWQCIYLERRPIQTPSKNLSLPPYPYHQQSLISPSSQSPTAFSGQHILNPRPPNNENAAAILNPLLRRNPQIPRPHHANRPNRPRNHPLHRPRHNPQPTRNKSQHRRYHHGTYILHLPQATNPPSITTENTPQF